MKDLFYLQMVTERDKSLRLAVLDTLEALYKLEGEATVWIQVGSLNSQQKSLIEERFKAVSRQAAKLQTQMRLESNGNAADQSESPHPTGLRAPRLTFLLAEYHLCTANPSPDHQ